MSSRLATETLIELRKKRKWRECGVRCWGVYDFRISFKTKGEKRKLVKSWKECAELFAFITKSYPGQFDLATYDWINQPGSEENATDAIIEGLVAIRKHGKASRSDAVAQFLSL